MLMKPEDFPLLDLYLELSNEISIETYNEVISDFVELWGVDVHIFIDNLCEYTDLEKLLDILEKTPLNTYSFNDGVAKNKFNYSDVNLIKYCSNKGVNSIVIPINSYLILNKDYVDYLKCVKEIIKFEVYFKIDKSNVDDLNKIVDFCIEENIKLCIVDIDKNTSSEQRIINTEYGRLIEKIRKINEKKKIRLSIAECPYLNAVENKTLNNMLGGCSGGLTSCFIKGNGDVIPCIYLPQVVVGNVQAKRLVEIWKNSHLFLKLRDRLNIMGKCKECQYLMSCGGCRAESYFKYNNLFYEDSNCWIV